jgi:arylsulfatase A-like enzyme
MNRIIELLLAVAASVVAAMSVSAEDPAAPNILLILTDDHGWSQMSAAIDPRIPESVSTYLETPHMDRLAEQGMRFTSGYSPAPLCTPTRRSILCGTSAARSGSEFKSAWVPADHMTIPKALSLDHVDPATNRYPLRNYSGRVLIPFAPRT